MLVIKSTVTLSTLIEALATHIYSGIKKDEVCAHDAKRLEVCARMIRDALQQAVKAEDVKCDRCTSWHRVEFCPRCGRRQSTA